MEGETAALVLEKDTVVPRREAGDQRTEPVELVIRETAGYGSVAKTPFETVVSSDPAGEGCQHAGKFIDRSAAYHGDGAVEPASQLTQKFGQLGRHPHQAGGLSDLDECSIKVEK